MVDKLINVNDHLKGSKYLVGNNITIADICFVSSISPLLYFAFDESIRANFPRVVEIYNDLKSKKEFIKYTGSNKLS